MLLEKVQKVRLEGFAQNVIRDKIQASLRLGIHRWKSFRSHPLTQVVLTIVLKLKTVFN